MFSTAFLSIQPQAPLQRSEASTLWGYGMLCVVVICCVGACRQEAVGAVREIPEQEPQPAAQPSQPWGSEGQSCQPGSCQSWLSR